MKITINDKTLTDIAKGLYKGAEAALDNLATPKMDIPKTIDNLLAAKDYSTARTFASNLNDDKRETAILMVIEGCVQQQAFTEARLAMEFLTQEQQSKLIEFRLKDWIARGYMTSPTDNVKMMLNRPLTAKELLNIIAFAASYNLPKASKDASDLLERLKG